VKVIPQGSLIADNRAAVFPLQNTPSGIFTDYMFNVSPLNAADLNEIKIDQVSGCAVASPLFVPHEQNSTSLANPNIGPTDEALIWDYDPAVDIPSGYEVGYDDAGDLGDGSGSHPPGGCQLIIQPAVTWTPDPSDVDNYAELSANLDGGETVTSNARAQGATFFVGWDPADVAGATPSVVRCQWRIGEALYSLALSVGNSPVLELADESDPDNTTYQPIYPSVKTSDSQAANLQWTPDDATDSADYYRTVQVTFLNYMLSVVVGGTTVPITLPISLSSDFDPVLSELKITAGNFTYLSVSAHLTKWVRDAAMRSGPVNVGEPPAIQPFYKITGVVASVLRLVLQDWQVDFPQGSRIVVDRPVPFNSINQQYDLYIFNVDSGFVWQDTPYADLTAAVTRIGICVAGTWYALGSSTPLTLIPKEVQEDIVFDPNQLTVRHTLSFVLDNQHGQHASLQGDRAIQYQVGYVQPSVALQTRFVGVARSYEYERSSASQANVRWHCEDQMFQLQNSYLFSPPDFDGWNQYSVMAYLAQVAGIHASQMAFRFLVPAVDPFTGGETTLGDNWSGLIDPHGYSPADPAPYFLPFGFGMRPWTPVDRSMPVLEIMNYVRQPAGFLLFFDALGYLHYEQWIPPTAAAIKKTFTESPTGSDGSNLSEVWNTSVRSSTEDVRNQVAVIGIDAIGISGGWNPIVVKLDDPDSWLNPSVINYIGYKAPFVWVDSRFANIPFAERAALALFRFMRIPEYAANFECYMQPTIFPMDTVALQEFKSGIWTLPLYVMAMQTTWTLLGGAMRFRSSLQTQFITPF
jgi:hypothetical protein